MAELSRDGQLQRLWEERRRCELKNAMDPYTIKGSSCNRTWDNILCWSDTPAGETASQPCPYYIVKFDTHQTVTRYCTENGTWWVNPHTGQPWSNYSLCEKPINGRVPQLIEEHMPGIKLMYTIGYALSLSTLIFALVIMIYFRRLHCKRNLIHINMFLAFGARAALLLMKNILLVNDLGFSNDVNQTGSTTTFIYEGPHWECKMFFTFISYIIVASLMWLLNEGLYLHFILTVAVFADKTKVRWFVLLGWGLPLVFVIPWVVCRIYLDDVLCWNIHPNKNLFYILHGPMMASVAINFAIFVNIVRLLYTKLTASHCPDSKMIRYRKLAKSTLILIPLFATYYMGFIWLPDDISDTVDLFKIYVEMLFNSFQGFLVALMFCFLNHEVQYEIRKKWQRRSWKGSPTRKFQSHGFLSHRSEIPDPDDYQVSKNMSTTRNLRLTEISTTKTGQKDSYTSNNKPSTMSLSTDDVFEVHCHARDDAEKPFLVGGADDHQVPLSLVNENYTGSYSQPCPVLKDSNTIKDEFNNIISCNGFHSNATGGATDSRANSNNINSLHGIDKVDNCKHVSDLPDISVTSPQGE